MTPTAPQQALYCPWGHDIQSPKPNNTTRLNYKKTNSIGTRAFTNGLITLYQCHKEFGIDIVLYTETNTNWQQPTTRDLNETHCRKLYHNATFAYSTRNTSNPQWYQPGGMMIPSTGTIAA
jgi:nicotinamide riboside kinase